MKKMYKVLMFGIMLAVLAVGSAVPSFGQQDPQKEKEALYAKYIANYDKGIEKRKIAVQAGKEYLQKFGSGDKTADPLIAYFETNVPVIEQTIKEAATKEKEDALAADKAKADALLAADAAKRAERFNKSVIGKNYPEVFASGKDIIENKPDYLLDVYIVLASIGYDQSLANDNTYNNDAVDYAKKAIQSIEKGEKSDNYGVSFNKDVSYVYKTKEYPDGKENALGWLNFNVGYIMFYNQKKQKEALPYLYEATKHDSVPKKSPALYRMIGEYYFNQVATLEAERQKIRTSLGNKDNEKSLELFAMQKGYADRGMDAYARAYNIASADATTPADVKQGLNDRFKKLYTFRNNGKDEGADAYLPTVNTKPLPNPSTPVQPIIDEADKDIPVTDETKPDAAMDKDKPAMTDKDKSMKATDKTKPAMDKDKPAMTDKDKPMKATDKTKPADTKKKPAAKPKKS